MNKKHGKENGTERGIQTKKLTRKNLVRHPIRTKPSSIEMRVIPSRTASTDLGVRPISWIIVFALLVALIILHGRAAQENTSFLEKTSMEIHS
jgi:hypothetical protein